MHLPAYLCANSAAVVTGFTFIRAATKLYLQLKVHRSSDTDAFFFRFHKHE